MAGVGTAGLAIPFVMNLLENYGFRTTPRAWAAAQLPSPLLPPTTAPCLAGPSV